MKIGIDARSMFGTPTGVGRYLANLVRQLQRIDQENTYWLYTDRHAPAAPQFSANFYHKQLTLPALNNYFTWNHLRLPPELWLHPVDLFHFPFYTMPVFRNYRSIVTIHDITYEIHPEWYSWKGLVAMRFFSKYAARHADRILTDSQCTKRDLVTHYQIPEAKIHVIACGVEERFQPLADREILSRIKATYQITASQVVLYVGSIHTRRNVTTLIRAFQRVCQHVPDVQLVLVGKLEYPYLDLPALMKELGVTRQVLWPGYVRDEDLPGLYNLADAFIYPSSYEGFGLPVLEAMACGTPVITANTSSLPEVVGDAAILIDPVNLGDMTDAMTQLLNNADLRQDFSARGIARARQFSWERTARETLHVYQEVGGCY